MITFNDNNIWDYKDPEPEPERKPTVGALNRKIKRLEARIENLQWNLYQERKIVNLQRACLMDIRHELKTCRRVISKIQGHAAAILKTTNEAP